MMSVNPDRQGGTAVGSLFGDVSTMVATPALLVSLDAVERNLKTMADRCKAAGKALRPHAKSHKSPWLATQQVRAGAVGICCAKIHEAEEFVRCGVESILITSPPASLDEIRRIGALSRIADISIVLDDVNLVPVLDGVARTFDTVLSCLVDLDVGQLRTGVTSPSDAVRLSRTLQMARGLTFAGIQGYDGHVQATRSVDDRRIKHADAMGMLQAAVDAVSADGIDVRTVTTAGTGTVQFALEYDFVTEVQPGSYATMDATYRDVEGVDYETAVVVATSVMSVQQRDRVILNAGYKAVSFDSGPAIPTSESVTYRPMGDEHGCLTGVGVANLNLHDIVELIPSHSDTTFPLYSMAYLVSGGRIVSELSLTARSQR